MTDIRPTLPAEPDRPKYKAPAGSCNAHAHVFGPFDKYPMPGPRFSAEATGDMFLRLLEVMGFDRGVLTQPSHYKNDNSCMLDLLERTRDKGNIKGVVVLPVAEFTDKEIARLDKIGVTGVRVREKATDGGLTFEDLPELGKRLAGTGWHIEFSPPKTLGPIVALRETIEKLPIPVCIAQLGGPPDMSLGAEDPNFKAVASMLKDGTIWVKLSHPYHLTEYPYDAAMPIAQALVAANSNQCVFATDWPHPRPQEHKNVPDDGFLVDLFAKWVTDEPTRKKILVDNAAKLYRF